MRILSASGSSGHQAAPSCSFPHPANPDSNNPAPHPVVSPPPPPICPGVGSGKCKTILEHRAAPGRESLAPSCRSPVVGRPHLWRRAMTTPSPPRRGCRVSDRPCAVPPAPRPRPVPRPAHKGAGSWDRPPVASACVARHDRPRATPRAPGADVPLATHGRGAGSVSSECRAAQRRTTTGPARGTKRRRVMTDPPSRHPARRGMTVRAPPHQGAGP